MKGFILACMLFCHVVDDYYLQGVLANMKQRSWWLENDWTFFGKRKDHLMALGMHSFSWAFMIMLPLTVYSLIVNGVWFPWLYVIHAVIHFYVDDLKANKRKIHLCQDQTVHILQIIITWLWWIL